MAGESEREPTPEQRRIIAEIAKSLIEIGDVYDCGRVLDQALLEVGSELEIGFDPATNKLWVK